jgi:hypothetical protein
MRKPLIAAAALLALPLYLFNDDLDTSLVFECQLDPTCAP